MGYILSFIPESRNFPAGVQRVSAVRLALISTLFSLPTLIGIY